MIYKYYLGLGSNIEPKYKYLSDAIIELNIIGQVKEKSAIYTSQPWGYSNQKNFINAVVRFYTNLNPFELLSSLKLIEEKIGRNKQKEIWGPREIDIDILFSDHISIKKNYLTIPHKHFKDRNFVLKPMAELNQNYIPDDYQQNIDFYLNNSNDQNSVNISIEDW